MTITASMVKELRQSTGAGMMDCKKALQETSGDMSAAIDWLRKKGLSKAAKKASRIASEGLIAVALNETDAAIIEINSETDFVARNEKFQNLAQEVAQVALKTDGSILAILASHLGDTGKTVENTITDAVATIGENMTLRRCQKLNISSGFFASYVHNSVAPNLGKIGVIVGIKSAADKVKLTDIGKQIAMHIAATNPLAIQPEDIDPTVIEKERKVLSEQARESGKPENVIEKMVEGRLRKFFEEITLLKQSFVINPDITVEQAVQQKAQELGTDIAIDSFALLKLGEGVEKKETDFAAEVAATAKV